MRSLLLSLIVLSLACGDDSTGFDAGDDGRIDAGPILDASGDDVGEDAGTTPDAGAMVDAFVAVDAGPVVDAGADAGNDAGSDAGNDAGSDAGNDAGTDAGTPDAGDACHAYTFGQPSVEFRGVATLPTMTGGVIPLGIYDAVDAQTTGDLRPTYRATWAFEDDAVLQTLEQLTISGAPSTPVPRTQSYIAAGTSLQRARNCGGSDTFDNQYRVRTEGDNVFLDVRQDGLLFTFQQR